MNIYTEGLLFQEKELDGLKIQEKLDFYVKEVTSKTEFLCKLYREDNEVKLWPPEKRPTDIANGNPKAKIIPKKVSKGSDKEEMDSAPLYESSEYSSEDNQSDEDQPFLNLMLLKKPTEEMEVEEEEEKDDEKQEKFDPLIMNLSLSEKEIAQNSMSLWMSLCDDWNEILHSDPANLWLADELYRDPLLAVVILSRIPVCYYLTINLKKIYSNSCVNCSAERKLKFPKFAVGTYSHSFNMETVTELQGINEYLLNQDYIYREENLFNEVAYFILKLIEVIKLQDKFVPVKKLWDEATERANIIFQNHKFYSYVFHLFK